MATDHITPKCTNHNTITKTMYMCVTISTSAWHTDRHSKQLVYANSESKLHIKHQLELSLSNIVQYQLLHYGSRKHAETRNAFKIGTKIKYRLHSTLCLSKVSTFTLSTSLHPRLKLSLALLKLWGISRMSAC